jgi:hypothetical protein
MQPEGRPNYSVAALLAEYRAARTTATVEEAQQESSSEDDLEDGTEADDPYRVKLDRLTRVSHDEFNASSRCALHPCYTFDLARLEQVSRHAYANPQQPRDYYAQDTAPLLDALVLSCSLESVARRAATQIPFERLLVVENGDVSSIIERLCTDEEMRGVVKETAEQQLFALMAIENATRHQPASVRAALNGTAGLQ